MKKSKKFLSLVLVGTFIIGSSTTVLAVTPQWTNPIPEIPDISNIELPDSVKDKINSAVNEYLKDHPLDLDGIEFLSTPKVTSAKYVHSNYFWNRNRLQITWDKVDKAEYYEVKVTKTDGTSKTYTSDNTSIFVYKDDDDFITDCVRSGSVQVRACGENIGSSMWSDAKTISCNALHRS